MDRHARRQESAFIRQSEEIAAVLRDRPESDRLHGLREAIRNVELGEERAARGGSGGYRKTKLGRLRRQEREPKGAVRHYTLTLDHHEFAVESAKQGARLGDIVEIWADFGAYPDGVPGDSGTRSGSRSGKKGAPCLVNARMAPGGYLQRARTRTQDERVRRLLNNDGKRRANYLVLVLMLEDFGNFQREYGFRCPNDFSERLECTRSDCSRRGEAAHFHYPPTSAAEIAEIRKNLSDAAPGRFRKLECEHGQHEISAWLSRDEINALLSRSVD